MKEIEFHNAKQVGDIYFEWCIIPHKWLLKATISDGNCKLYLFENLKQVEEFMEKYSKS